MIQLVTQPRIQRETRVDFPIVLNEKMFVAKVLDTEEIPRKGAAALERKAEKIVAECISGIRSAEGEIATASGRVRRRGIVTAELGTELQSVSATNPGDA